MANLAKIDSWEGGMLRTSGNRVVECTRVAHVTGLVKPSEAALGSALDVVRQAIGTDPASSTIGYWVLHPIHNSGENLLRSVEYSVVSTGPNTARVEVRYLNANTLVKSGGSAIEAVETDLDRDGYQVTVTYRNLTQAGSFVYLEPQWTVVLERLEPATMNPMTIKAMYEGKINADNFLVSGSIGKWLLELISFTNAGFEGAAFRTSYQFRYKTNGWQPQVVWVDPETNRPAAGATLGNGGRRNVLRYFEANFSSLNLLSTP